MTDAPTRPAAPAALDPRDWQATLVGLLATLEELRGLMAGLDLRADAPRLLDVADAMVGACDGLTDEVPVPAAAAAAHAAAAAKAGAYYTAAAKARAARKSGVFLSVLSALTGGGGPAAADLRDTLMAMVEAVHQYFTLYTDLFTDPDAARSFVDAAVAFTSDLKDLVRTLPEG